MGARCQMVIPRAIREQVGLRANSRVQVRASGDAVIIQPVGATPRGIGRELAGEGVDATEYVRRLRAEWTDRV